MIKSRELMKLAYKNGWYLHSIEGSHHHFKHPTIKGKLTISHPRSNFKLKTLHSILKKLGLR